VYLAICGAARQCSDANKLARPEYTNSQRRLDSIKGTAMKMRIVALALGVASALLSGSSHAGGHRQQARGNPPTQPDMRVVAHGATAGEPGYRWRYFSDTLGGRAVVISPGGDYFYSDGSGLVLVFKGSAASTAGQSPREQGGPGGPSPARMQQAAQGPAERMQGVADLHPATVR
jgi:hypothetical protein